MGTVLKESKKETKFVEDKYFFYIPRNTIKFLGFWPGSDVIHPLQIAFVIFNALEIWGYGIFQVNFCLENRDDLVKFLIGCTPLVTQIVTSFKVLVFVWRRSDIKKLLDYLHNSFLSGM